VAPTQGVLGDGPAAQHRAWPPPGQQIVPGVQQFLPAQQVWLLGQQVEPHLL